MNDGVVMAVPGTGRVLDLFHGARLTPTQRRIAHCLVQHAASAAYLSASEVAALAGVSQPSVTRFATALGYDGYPALRRRLREAITGTPVGHPATGDAAGRDAAGYAATGDAATGGPGGGNEMQRAVRAEADNLYRLAEQLSHRDAVTRAGELLAASRPLPVLGLRAAAPLAGYFGYFAAKVHPEVRVLDTGGSLLLDRLDQAHAAGAGAILAVVLPRYPREALDALRECRAAGLKVVVITDSAISPAAELADIVLPAAVGAQLVFDLHTAPMALAMVLLQAMCDAAPEAAQRRLEHFEAAAARRHIFAP